MSWPVVALGDICSPKQWPVVSKAEMSDRGYPVYGANGRIGFFERYTHEEPTILIGCRGSCGTVHLTEPKSYANGNAMALDNLLVSSADVSYLAHYFRMRGFRDVTTGTSQPQIIRQNLVRVEVPLPSLPEQRRIAEVLDRAESLRTQRRQALAQLDALAEAIFLGMFGDPVRNVMGWPEKTIGDIGDVQGGLQLSASRSKLPIEVPYLRVANVYRERLSLDEIKRFRATEQEIQRTRLQADDLLIVEGHGNPEEIGRCALWDGSIQECSHQNHLIRVRVDSRKCSPVFMSRFLNSAGGRRGLLSASNTTSGLNTISVSKVRACRVITPPLSIQKAFESRIGRVSKLKCAQQAALHQLDALFASLQHRAFRGEL